MATVALVSSLVLGSWGAAQAQDGTGGAPPLEETNCVLVPASDLEALQDVPDTSPASTTAASPTSDQASSTPASSQLIMGPAATPIATPATEMTAPSNDELLTEDLVAASTSLTSCLTEGNFNQVVDHTSPIFRGQLVGYGRPLPGDVYISLAESFPPIEYSVLEILNPTLVDDTTATADVVWQLAHQIRVDQWTVALAEVQGLTVWTVEMAAPSSATPSIEATSITTTISGNRYTLNPATVADDTVLFEVTNNDQVDHELLVLRLGDGVTSGVLLRTPGPQLPEGVTMIGQATIERSGSGRLLLTSLEPGSYTIVCLLPDQNGVPHLADGMETAFTVEAP